MMFDETSCHKISYIILIEHFAKLIDDHNVYQLLWDRLFNISSDGPGGL